MGTDSPMTLRHAVLLAGLLLTGSLLWFDRAPPANDLAQAVARPARLPRPPGSPEPVAASRSATPSASAAGLLPALQARHAPERNAAQQRDLFAARSWAPAALPAPPALANAAPAVATAPPLPFQYIGRQRSAGTEQVFLADGDEVHVVQLHSLIRNTYRVEQLAPTFVVLTYLPMNLMQRIPTGSID